MWQSGSSLYGTDQQLSLASYEYFQLVELLIFHIELPKKGLKDAFAKLQEMPLPSRIRTKFTDRLNELRNMVVADVQLQNKSNLSLKQDNEGKEKKTKSGSDTIVANDIEDQLEAIRTDGHSLE